MNPKIMEYIFTFLSGGLVTYLISFFLTTKIDKKKRIQERLKEQIEILYAPVYFLLKQNTFYYNYSANIQDAWENVFVEKNQNGYDIKDAITEAEINKKVQVFYITKIIENNNLILELIKKSFMYIDFDDLEIFEKFINDCSIANADQVYSLRNTNISDEVWSKISSQLGAIYYYNKSFINRIESKYKKKKDEYEKNVKGRFKKNTE